MQPGKIDQGHFSSMPCMIDSGCMTNREEIPSNYTWSDNYLVNIHKIDAQHKALFATAGKLYRLLLGHEDLKKADDIFSDLVRLTLIHFKTEEEIMQSYGYPDYPQHKELHDILLQQLKDMQSSQQAMQSASFEQPWLERLEVADYLSGWLVNHIVDEDRKYEGFLRDAGLR